MHKTKEILRLKWVCKLSNRKIGQSCLVSPSTVFGCLARALEAGLDWEQVAELDEDELVARLYAKRVPSKLPEVEPDFQHIYRELAKKHVTLLLLWQEYRGTVGETGYSYSQYCKRYRDWRKHVDMPMRQQHKAGDKGFVDYAGMTMPVHDQKTGEITQHPVFVYSLGASNYTYAEAQERADMEAWIGGHIRTFEFFGGVPAATVPDNLKVGVTKPNFYDPDVNPTYEELAKHYSTVILPARVRRPKDKAKVENAVLQVERWVLAPLRNQRFFSLEAANQAIAERLAWLNNRDFSKLEGCRRSLFETIDQPALKPLPTKRFEIAITKPNVGVSIDYHVEFERHYYSVPYTLVGKRLQVRATKSTVECLYSGKRVASHLRSPTRGGYTTTPAHMPKAHQKAQWSPTRLIGWAETFGPHAAELITKLMEERPHPEQGYRTGLGILRLGKKYGDERLEAACKRALIIGSRRVRSVRSILDAGLDKQDIEADSEPITPIAHEHVRGADYYDQPANEQEPLNEQKEQDAQRTDIHETQSDEASRAGPRTPTADRVDELRQTRIRGASGDAGRSGMDGPPGQETHTKACPGKTP